MNSEMLNQKKVKFGTYDAALATLLFVVFNFIFMEGYYAFAMKFGMTELGVVIAQFLVEALFGAAAVAVAYFCKINIIKAAGMNKKISVSMFIYGALIAFCSIIFFASLTSSFLELLSLIGYTSSSSSFQINTFAKYIGYVIAACVAPAVCEELLFRGLIQSGLKKYGKWISIISASLIFMLMHGGPDQTVHQFIIGIIVGLLFFETGNVWLGVIVHFFNNFISVTELYVFNMMFKSAEETVEESTEIAEAISSTEVWSQFALNLTIALVFAAVGFMIVRFLMKKMIQEDKKINSCVLNENKADSAVLVDGVEIKTTMTVSDNQYAIEEDELLKKPIKTDEKSEDNEPMTLTTKFLFAIPIAWIILTWILTFLSGL